MHVACYQSELRWQESFSIFVLSQNMFAFQGALSNNFSHNTELSVCFFFKKNCSILISVFRSGYASGCTETFLPDINDLIGMKLLMRKS